MTLNRKSQGQGHRERSQLRRSHQGLFPCKVSSLYWLMWPRTNLNAEVNQMLTDGRTDRRTDRQTDGRTDGHHQSISRNCFAIRPIIGTHCFDLDLWTTKYIGVFLSWFLIDVQGFFSVHFMAEIWLYSHWQINQIIKKYVVKQRF